MEKYSVVKYSPTYYNEWNDFVLHAKNATFLFHRDFMEYHKDRFEDFSLMVYSKNTLVSVLPANIYDNKIYSHQGLSYGGLILDHKSSFQSVLESFCAILKYFSEQKINIFILKQLPKIYHLRPSDELDYLLFIVKAKLYRKDISMAIPLNNTMEFSTLRKRKIKMAKKNGLYVKLENDLTSFWNDVLIPNLRNSHSAKPVHSLTEIHTLSQKFSKNIKQYNVYLENDILAGCTVFETETVAHLQYISTKKEKNMGALDYLINELVNTIYKNKLYFDFGISNENQGKCVNLGLLNWKQSFGASSIIHDYYKIETANHHFLKTVFI